MKKIQTKRVTRKPSRKIPTHASRLRRRRYLPALAISVFATFIWMQPYVAGILSPTSGVLAYATNVSISGLLGATNSQRSANGVGSLELNSLLSAAAQAKANDMATRNYWSHQTPDGRQPWWFITNAGYQYLSAGENLAYGFMTSNATVTGWMNSPSHRANMLNGTFTEVGFGMANSENYVGNGQQTIVVAMYAKPQKASAPAPAPSTAQPKAQAQTKPASTPTPTQPVTTPVVEQPEAEPSEPAANETSESEPEAEPIAIADTSAEPPVTAAPTKVSRVQLLTGGGAVWSATFVALAVLAASGLWIIHKGIHLRRYMVAGERFLAHHHIHLDLTMLAVVYLGVVLLATGGTIR